MRTLRTIHTYLSCAVAPLLISFVLTGSGQVLGLHEPAKSGYTPSRLVLDLSDIHTHGTSHDRRGSAPFRCLVLIMAFGVLCTTVLGLVMAFLAAKRRWLVSVCVILGIVVPCAVIIAVRVAWVRSFPR